MSEVMEQPVKTVKAAKPALKKYKITFHGEGGDVEIAHNYRLNLYKRNVETVIDEHFLAVLRDAVIHTVIEDAEGKRRAVTIPMHSYTLGEAV
jgi:transposase-like protein